MRIWLFLILSIGSNASIAKYRAALAAPPKKGCVLNLKIFFIIYYITLSITKIYFKTSVRLHFEALILTFSNV